MTTESAPEGSDNHRTAFLWLSTPEALSKPAPCDGLKLKTLFDAGLRLSSLQSLRVPVCVCVELTLPSLFKWTEINSTHLPFLSVFI